MTVNFLTAALHHYLLDNNWRKLLVVCFGLTFLFSNFGPNTTTFVIPVEIYPTVVRATCHGLSAAAGKVGAVIGTVAFSPMENAWGVSMVLAACGVVCLVGAAATMAFTSDEVCDFRELDKDLIQQE